MKAGTIPFPREFTVGDSGIDCRAVKRALASWFGKPDGLNLKNNVFGPRAGMVLKAFQNGHGLQPDGVYGPATHEKMRPYFDEFGASLMAKKAYSSSAQKQRDDYVAAWRWAIAHRVENDYREVRPIPLWLAAFEVSRRIETDCSGESVLLAEWEHLPDPGGMAFNGQGNCHSPETRLLREDLRWVPAGDVGVGDTLWAFDENKNEGVGRGRARRFRRASVLKSELAMKECVRVCIDTGESFVCTTDHPWLMHPQPEAHHRWRVAERLVPGSVLVRTFIPWLEERTYSAGWLAGMFDGEGWVANSHRRRGRSGEVGIVQRVSPTAEKIVAEAQARGSFHVKVIQPVMANSAPQVYVTSNGGGCFAAAEFLGKVRPERLIANFSLEDITVKDRYGPRVVSVENVGVREIQSITTSTGTYIAEGFAVHNTGTILHHCTHVTVAQALPADLIVYRAGSWDLYGHHVVTILSRLGPAEFELGSNGHQGDPGSYLHSQMAAGQAQSGYPDAVFCRWLPAP